MSESGEKGTQNTEVDEKGTDSVLPSKKGRSNDFRIKQLDIGAVENAVYRKNWWQIWCVNIDSIWSF